MKSEIKYVARIFVLFAAILLPISALGMYLYKTSSFAIGLILLASSLIIAIVALRTLLFARYYKNAEFLFVKTVNATAWNCVNLIFVLPFAICFEKYIAYAVGFLGDLAWLYIFETVLLVICNFFFVNSLMHFSIALGKRLYKEMRLAGTLLLYFLLNFAFAALFFVLYTEVLPIFASGILTLALEKIDVTLALVLFIACTAVFSLGLLFFSLTNETEAKG